MDIAKQAAYLLETEWPDTLAEITRQEQEQWQTWVPVVSNPTPRQMFRIAWLAGVFAAAHDADLSEKARVLEAYLRNRLL